METLENIIGQSIARPELISPKPFVASGDKVEELSPAAKIARNMEVYYNNPWAMVEDECIFTLDQTDLLNPIKPFPNKKWLEAISQIWRDENLLALYKSRRMTCTWLFVFLHLWLAMFREGVAIFFVSDKEDKSDELVKRAEFIYKYIPENMVLKPRIKSSYCYLEFPGLNSYIQGVPQGAGREAGL